MYSISQHQFPNPLHLIRTQAAITNENLLSEARIKYQFALQNARTAHTTACNLAKQSHQEALATIKSRNQLLLPTVLKGRAAQAELARVCAFFEHIRLCARKMEIGVNLRPGTPNVSRVVEMQAMNEALARAFPGINPKDYPWPCKGSRGGVGLGDLGDIKKEGIPGSPVGSRLGSPLGQ